MTFKIAMMVFDYMKYLREKRSDIQMPGRKKRGSRNLKIMLSAMGITILALLILALAAYLLIGGKAVSSETESEQADQETDVNEGRSGELI